LQIEKEIRDNPPKTNLAVSSIEFCQCKFDERDIRERLGGGSGHRVMIPLVSMEGSHSNGVH
jgi:hypothetical protein